MTAAYVGLIIKSWKFQRGAIPLPPQSGSKKQKVHVTSNKQSKVLLMGSAIQGWHGPHPFPGLTGWCGLLEAWWSQQVVAGVKLKNELHTKAQRAFYITLFWHHFLIAIRWLHHLHNALAGNGEIGNTGVWDGLLVYNFLCYPCWTKLKVNKNRAGPQRQTMSVPCVWRQMVPRMGAHPIFSRSWHIVTTHWLNSWISPHVKSPHVSWISSHVKSFHMDGFTKYLLRCYLTEV